MTNTLKTAACLLVLLLPSLPAQLSGNYTVNPGGSGARNYRSFGAAVLDLWQNGVNGPVTMTVASGVYTESFSIVPIPGTSTSNPVTFKSAVRHAAVFRPLTNNAITFDLSSTNNPIVGVVLDGLRFEDDAWIDARTHSTDVEIKNCHFSGHQNGIRADDITRWDVHHNLFEAYRALEISGYDDCTIHHNEFVFDRSDGIWASMARVPLSGPLKIYNNLFTGRIDSRASAVDLRNGGYGAEISHNTIRVSNDSPWDGCLHLIGVVSIPTKVFGNILVNQRNGPLLAVETISPFEIQIDGNLYHPEGGGAIAQVWVKQNTRWNFSTWKSVSGQDRNSLQADPRFRGGSPYDLRPGPGSPANGLAVGTPSYVTDDFDGKTRINPATSGAFVFDATSWRTFGSSCFGSGNRHPIIHYTGVLDRGSTNFAVALSNALGGITVRAFLVVGASQQTIPFGGSCNLLVSPDLLLPMSMGGGTGPGTGTASLQLNLPNNPALFRKQAHFQWAVADPAATPGGFAFSTGATLTL